MRCKALKPTSDSRLQDFLGTLQSFEAYTPKIPGQGYFPAAAPRGSLTPGRGSTYRRGNSVQRFGTTAYRRPVDPVQAHSTKLP